MNATVRVLHHPKIVNRVNSTFAEVEVDGVKYGATAATPEQAVAKLPGLIEADKLAKKRKR